MTHTKGPWTARELLKDKHSIIQREGTWEISTPNYDVCTDVQGGGPIRNEADACLMAAGPELLNELWNMVNQARNGRLTNEDIWRAREAIAKAEGR
jgi:hypothetical protein